MYFSNIGLLLFHTTWILRQNNKNAYQKIEVCLCSAYRPLAYGVVTPHYTRAVKRSDATS